MSPDDRLIAAIQTAAQQRPDRPLVVGICGAQGSGKSTLAARLAQRLDRAAMLSLDDLYLTRAERERLARDVHPLLRTRGAPGTHDIELGLSVMASLDRGAAVHLPRFDKATDDRRPESSWPTAPANAGVLLFEGWCVGARPQDDEALVQPVNALERQEDRDGVWRRYVNAMLAGPYRALFERIDLLVLLAAPGWNVVYDWRLEQEEALRHSGAPGDAIMTAAEVGRFISHYERVTRHILAEMPQRADIVMALDAHRHCLSIDRP
jgi:D-glycerate 3-kinase